MSCPDGTSITLADGAKGADGAAGTNGTNGADGKSALIATAPQGGVVRVAHVA